MNRRQRNRLANRKELIAKRRASKRETDELTKLLLFGKLAKRKSSEPEGVTAVYGEEPSDSQKQVIELRMILEKIKEHTYPYMEWQEERK